MTTGGRLRVDPIACDGRGMCAEVLPELISLDDWGFPIIASGDVPPGLWREAQEAIRLCPKLALRLDLPAGRTLAGNSDLPAEGEHHGVEAAAHQRALPATGSRRRRA